MQNLREALDIVREEKEKALKELALSRKHNVHLVDSLDKSVDAIMLKDKQLKDLRSQLEQTREALECAKMQAAVRQACSENQVKTLREEIEAQKADIEELRGSNEDLKSVVQKFSKDVWHQQDHIALRYMESESAENAMEALRKAIKESQEAQSGKYVSAENAMEALRKAIKESQEAKRGKDVSVAREVSITLMVIQSGIGSQKNAFAPSWMYQQVYIPP
ncbi:hypothetical protein JR316_0000893 [Psilocybe cubensis]|nr:hypothetical protein JR316_0000893 [Psilocybe cubensis]KAH9486828.1 hypothetical protein JR316_0000893 [Psilocybe cubensis]